jgi:hypothetical protein
MIPLLKGFRLGATVLVTAVMLVGAVPNVIAVAQTVPSLVGTSVALTEPTIKALQEALNKQGIVVKVDGVLDDNTRAAISKYQSQHHLPISGEPDKATLDKLGVRQSAASGQSPVFAQATPASPAGPPSSPAPDASTQPSQTPGNTAMSCPMMQGQMQAMMQMMQGMQGMMQMMQGQMQPGQSQPGQMQRGQKLTTPMGCPMMQGQMQAMMQMMQGMQGMMQMMQGPGQSQLGQMQPGQMRPGAR